MKSLEPFRFYWSNYGGWKALARSIYLWGAAVLTALCYPYWSVADSTAGRASAQLAVDIIPSLMAFSLGGMAIVLAFAGGRFLNAVRQGGKPDSLFMEIVANFFHFLFMQTLALAAAIVVKAFPQSTVLAGVAFFLLIYSLAVALASSAMLLNASRIFNKVGNDD